MCCFGALINNDGKIADNLLYEIMASIINYTGPDVEGIIIDGSVGFYHERLLVIDSPTWE
jgi:asparagine synthetase B (glutamine-hydrolysing)